MKGKKILLFAPIFFGYEKKIKAKLEELGAEVVFYPERVSEKKEFVFLTRYSKRFVKPMINNYYSKIIEKEKSKEYDFIFFINLENVTNEIIKKMKETQKKAKFIMYMWDSFLNKKKSSELIKSFDRVLSFDDKDKKVDEKIEFRPLFYIDEFSKMSKSKQNRIKFIGTAHSDRYKFLKKIESQLEGEKIKKFLFLKSKMFFWIKKYFDKDFKGAKKNEFNFIPLSFKEMLKEYDDSSIVIDLNHPLQVGLTMRTIEVIGMKKKLITTNSHIKRYDFYNKNNILIVDRVNPKVDKNFLKKEYEEIPDFIYKKYSLESWLKDCLIENKYN